MAVDINRVPKFKRRQKVVAVTELPGVPVGTKGKIYYEAGVTWFRYHVAFENGRELANVDGNAIVSVEDWAKQQREEETARLRAERAARNADAVVVSSGPGKH